MKSSTSPILEPGAFAHVFERWSGAAACVFWAPGNVGDRLIREGASALFHSFGIAVVSAPESVCDVVFWGGGGNMGDLYPAAKAVRLEARARASALRVPFIVLPQSWTGPDSIEADQFFARENASLRFCPSAVVAPDLALAWNPGLDFPAPQNAEGWFFRADAEATVFPPQNIADPATMAGRAEDLLRLAAEYEVVHTNRLHFAIAAMIAGQRAVLYANSYFKCHAVYDLWLRGRGCEWGELPA